MYNKLFTKILDSSIWLESDHTRIVWLTLIAAMDETGFAQFASVANLAHRAIVPVSAAEESVKRLEGPDANSSDTDHEGRRIERVPGGWMVLNAHKYRELVTRAVSQERTRARVAKHRAKMKGSNADVTAANGSVTPSEAKTDTESVPRATRSGAVRREIERTIPQSLDTQPFKAAWEKWVLYSAEKNNGRSIPQATFDSHLETCCKLGPIEAVAAIENAIARNLREPALPFSGGKSGGKNAAFA